MRRNPEAQRTRSRGSRRCTHVVWQRRTHLRIIWLPTRSTERIHTVDLAPESLRGYHMRSGRPYSDVRFSGCAFSSFSTRS